MNKNDLQEIIEPLTMHFDKSRIKHCENGKCKHNYNKDCMFRWLILDEDGHCREKQLR